MYLIYLTSLMKYIMVHPKEMPMRLVAVDIESRTGRKVPLLQECEKKDILEIQLRRINYYYANAKSRYLGITTVQNGYFARK